MCKKCPLTNGARCFFIMEERTAFTNSILICMKIRAKVLQCLSDTFGSRRHKTQVSLFTLLAYQFLQCLHVAHTVVEIHQKEQVDEAKIKLLFNQKMASWIVDFEELWPSQSRVLQQVHSILDRWTRRSAKMIFSVPNTTALFVSYNCL